MIAGNIMKLKISVMASMRREGSEGRKTWEERKREGKGGEKK